MSSNNETVTITRDEYQELKKDSLFLSILRRYDIEDNWKWYNDAVDEYNDEYKKCIDEESKMMTDHTIKTINQAVDTAREKHPFFARDENHALALLMEEVGEVARAVNDAEGNDHIKEELLHVIAICIRWIENDISL